jgi:Phosphopantetheine attachment site
MIPAEFVALDQMPLTPGGEPAPGTLEHRKPPPPPHDDGERRTPTQAGMSHLWSRLLNQPQISLDDDFFALGGNSLLAAEMLAYARSMFGIGADYVRPLTRCLLPAAGPDAARVRQGRGGFPRGQARP